MNTIKFDELKNLNDIYIIDIREKQLFNKNHLPNSINLNHSKLMKTPEKYINRDNTYYILCEEGITSQIVCNNLLNKGYNVITVIDGYKL